MLSALVRADWIRPPLVAALLERCNGWSECAWRSRPPRLAARASNCFVTFATVSTLGLDTRKVRIMDATAAEVVSPLSEDSDELAEVLSFFKAHEERHGSAPVPTYFLAGSGEHDRVELTEQLYTILKQAAQALSRGQSISILTRDQEITTQQAAEILGLSRPTVVKLIDNRDLVAHVPGSARRKLRLADVLTYREALRKRRNEFITDSSNEYDEDDTDAMADLLAEARRQK